MVTSGGMIMWLEAPKLAYRHIYTACGFDGMRENRADLPGIRTALPVESGSNCAWRQADALCRLSAQAPGHAYGYPA